MDCTCKCYACHQIEYLIINQTKKLPYFAEYIFLLLLLFSLIGMAIGIGFRGLQIHLQYLMILKSSIVANLFPQP